MMKILIGLIVLTGVALAADWTYSGPNGVFSWADKYGCTGSRQSPIDLPWELTYQSLPEFIYTGYDNMSGGSLLMKNNGHTAQIDINNPGQTKLSGGGLNGTYDAVQLHFHWGEDALSGSEHTFRGRQYPLEMHVVHYKADYGDVTTALGKGDGLAVLGVFFLIDDDEPNHKLDPLIDALEDIKYKGTNASVTLDFADLMPEERDYFYRYMGSLTTPGCNEAVVWTVFDNVNTISSAQLAKFRKLLENDALGDNHPIEWNYRPVQSLSGRTVYKNFDEDVPPSWHWGYEGKEGPEYWPDYYEMCTGNQQSPINIPKVNSPSFADFDPALGLDTLEFKNYEKELTGEILNNGHTVQVNILSPRMYLQHGGLSDEYIAAQFHFHWGADDMTGSEHTIEGRQFPLELHIVHYRERYGSIANAVGHPDGLAVVGFIYEVHIDANAEYNSIVSLLDDIKYQGNKTAISGVSLKNLTNQHLKVNNDTGIPIPFYRYMGSLTTPTCNQVVTWTVMRAPIHIHADQLAAFRRVTHEKPGTPKTHVPIKKNYRPVQSIGDRKVYPSYDFKRLSSAASGLPTNILATSFIVVLVALFK